MTGREPLGDPVAPDARERRLADAGLAADQLDGRETGLGFVEQGLQEADLVRAVGEVRREVWQLLGSGGGGRERPTGLRDARCAVPR